MECETLISKIEKYIANHSNYLNASVYQASCKLAAEVCFKNGFHMNGLYYLSESHGAALRDECLYQLHLTKIRNEIKKTASVSALNEKYISFSAAYSKSKYEGLVCRLKEMPKEWTVIQVTRPYDFCERWKTRVANSVSEVTKLHIVRYSCGGTVSPCHVKISEPKGLNGSMMSVLQLLSDATMDKKLHTRLHPAALIKRKRIQNSCQIKSVVKEIVTSWLQEWSCLFLGKLCDEELDYCIQKSVSDTFDFSEININDFDKVIIRQIANGCAHLSEDEIKSAVSQIIENIFLRKKLTETIIQIRNEKSNLIIAKRHPVILVLDEKLECVPWEMISVLRKHPVSRLPSIHFAHALYKKHEDSIINGNKVILDSELGFYIINPDLSLKNTEKRITSFLNVRVPKWRGLTGEKPSKKNFIDALTNYDIFMYCGHGNGTQYMNSCEIDEINVKTIPLLFGCSSFQHKDIGGRACFGSLSHHYIIAGSPCMFGMLWAVTNNDTDYMALTTLNHWLPGELVSLKGFEEFEAVNISSKIISNEPELLRVIHFSRNSALLFSNSSALVIYGIPVTVKQ